MRGQFTPITYEALKIAQSPIGDVFIEEVNMRKKLLVLNFIVVFLCIFHLNQNNHNWEQHQIIVPGAQSRTIQEVTDIKPEELNYKSGMKGWKLTIPGNRPIATVAYEDGVLFVGGGYGSYEFYAIDAESGDIAWMFKTGDDGPTAAVTRNGYVSFNTESCILYVLKCKTGEKVWEKWLGDPLMSQPAMDDKNVYMAYPGADGHHHLAAMTVEKGRPVWDVTIAGDLISAPILYKDSIYITCFDGTVYRFTKEKGKLIWSKKKNATCAPVIYDQRIFVSLRQEEQDEKDKDKLNQYEGIGSLKNEDGDQEQEELWAKKKADHFDVNRKTAKLSEQAALDSSVGFGMAPGAAKLDQAKINVGQYSVVGCWAYQGARPVIRNGVSYNAIGNTIQAIDIETGKVIWAEEYNITEEGISGRFFSPPAYANGRLFFGSGAGEVYCLNAKNGDLVWNVKVKSSISFQPAVAKGMVFISCDNGDLYCIKTGDSKDDGWYMWGGNSKHNK